MRVRSGLGSGVSYDDLEAALRTIPATMVPALLRVLVVRAVEVKVFQPGGLMNFVERAAGSSAEGATP